MLGHVSDTPTRVMIADDQDLVRAGFRLILDAQEGIEVVGEAADGLACVELARALRPDVCLVDVRMPKLDGLEVTRLLAGPGATHPTQVVVVTSFDQDDYLNVALRNGACGFLLKDAAPALLIEAVRAAARGDALVSPASRSGCCGCWRSVRRPTPTGCPNPRSAHGSWMSPGLSRWAAPTRRSATSCVCRCPR